MSSGTFWGNIFKIWYSCDEFLYCWCLENLGFGRTHFWQLLDGQAGVVPCFSRNIILDNFKAKVGNTAVEEYGLELRNKNIFRYRHSFRSRSETNVKKTVYIQKLRNETLIGKIKEEVSDKMK